MQGLQQTQQHGLHQSVTTRNVVPSRFLGTHSRVHCSAADPLLLRVARGEGEILIDHEYLHLKFRS
jgi:hypothetical protein